jgi:hypothetical protein
MTIGLAMALPAAYVQFSGRFPGWLEGASLIVGATGIALAWTGLTGVSPDWVEDSDASECASEPRERSAPAQRRARERVGESEGRKPLG